MEQRSSSLVLRMDGFVDLLPWLLSTDVSHQLFYLIPPGEFYTVSGFLEDERKRCSLETMPHSTLCATGVARPVASGAI